MMIFPRERLTRSMEKGFEVLSSPGFKDSKKVNEMNLIMQL